MADHNFMRRMAPFLVLEILKNHTDAEHGLKVTQVVELLEEDYGVTMERKAVSRILNDLYELTEISESYSWKHPMPYTIAYDSVPRSSSEIKENWHLYKRSFDDVELQLLMDAVQTVKGYPTAGLVEKLPKLGSLSMQKSYRKQGQTLGGVSLGNSMRYSMDAIMRAIRVEKKLTFYYENAEGQQVVSPYKMTLRNGFYYLVCFDENKDDMAIFQIEYMSNATVLDTPAKDYHMVKGASRWQYDLQQYLDQSLSL